MRRAVLLSLLFFLLVPVKARAQDPMEVAGQIERLLARGDVRSALQVLSNWEDTKDLIFGNFLAALRTGRALAKFGASPKAMRYQKIPEDCADAAMGCAEAAEAKIQEDDLPDRLALGQLFLQVAEIYIRRGQGDKGDKLLDRCLEHLTAVTGAAEAPGEAYMALGRLYGRLARRDPKKAEGYIAKSAEAFDKAGKKMGDSSVLCLRIGQTRAQLADVLRDQLSRDPKNRKLAKRIPKILEEALESYRAGLKLDAKNRALKTAYNECLWEYMGAKGGKAKQKPITKTFESRYHHIRLRLPDSSYWSVMPAGEIKDKDEIFSALKVNRKAGQALVIWVTQYKWDYYYVDEEAGNKFGGDNIGGLSRRSEKSMREYFVDIKERRPLAKFCLNRKIKKAQGFSMTGKTKDGDLMEYRTIFFKSSKNLKTYCLTLIANLGMLKRNPYELKMILDSVEVVSRR